MAIRYVTRNQKPRIGIGTIKELHCDKGYYKTHRLIALAEFSLNTPSAGIARRLIRTDTVNAKVPIIRRKPSIVMNCRAASEL